MLRLRSDHHTGNAAAAFDGKIPHHAGLPTMRPDHTTPTASASRSLSIPPSDRFFTVPSRCHERL